MNWGLILKINIMIVAFFVVLFAIRQLHTRGFEQGVNAVLGVPGEVKPDSAITTLDWCETRVVAMERSEKPIIRQEKLKWYAGKTAISSLEVEKWLGRNCRIRVERVAPELLDTSKSKPAMIVRFIKGEPVTLVQGESDLFRWQEETFRSAELTRALSDLDGLAPPTSH
jgi:hypothetical protein